MKTKSGKTLAMTDIRRAFRSTRKRDNIALAKRHGVTSTSEAHLLQLQEMHARMMARNAKQPIQAQIDAIRPQLEAATIAGDFAEGKRLSDKLASLKRQLNK